ncbi:MAG TPA: MAPEG family protein [Stellaceae bacterium]|jgi:glutathione S-transferase|nr:MAPEG family protein [Stellaceae bacterium]
MIWPFPAFVLILALILYIGIVLAVGRARGRHGVPAPAVTGAPEFERLFRVQQNTLEQIVWFIPALWLFALYVSPVWAGILGIVWIAGRVCYAISYCRDPASRGPAFGIAFISAGIMLLGAMIAIIWRLI